MLIYSDKCVVKFRFFELFAILHAKKHNSDFITQILVLSAQKHILRVDKKKVVPKLMFIK